MKCISCDKLTTNTNWVCDICFRDPQTNNCAKCHKHLTGIQYPYFCGDCNVTEKEREQILSLTRKQNGLYCEKP